MPVDRPGGRSPLEQAAQDDRPGPHVDPSSKQAKNLDVFSGDVAKMPEIFTDVQRRRDAYLKRLTEMVEETLKQIQKARMQMAQKARHVRATTKSFAAKFEHELSCTREELRRELSEGTSKIEDALGGLESQVGALEHDLQVQHEFRLKHIEEHLGPIRDEVLRITTALEEERRTRRAQEAFREKLLDSEVEDFGKLLDLEKFECSRQLGEFTEFANDQQQSLAKLQYQAEKEVISTHDDLRKKLEAITKDRVSVQHRVIESIASFVKRYHQQLALEVAM